jgi:hypothetical protein
VHPIQHQAIMFSLPSNVILRRSVADLLGGFPEDAVFRGRSAGEDACFRQALHANFEVATTTDKFQRYRVRRGSHFDYFLDRTEIVDGKIVFKHRAPEESSGAMATATLRYQENLRARLRAAAFSTALAQLQAAASAPA